MMVCGKECMSKPSMPQTSHERCPVNPAPKLWQRRGLSHCARRICFVVAMDQLILKKRENPNISVKSQKFHKPVVAS